MNEHEGDGLPTMGEEAEEAIDAELLAKVEQMLDDTLAHFKRYNEWTQLSTFGLIRSYELFMDLGIEPEFEVTL